MDLSMIEASAAAHLNAEMRADREKALDTIAALMLDHGINMNDVAAAMAGVE